MEQVILLGSGDSDWVLMFYSKHISLSPKLMSSLLFFSNLWIFISILHIQILNILGKILPK